MDPGTAALLIGIAGAAASGTAAYAGNQAQNRATRRSQQSAAKAAEVQSRQLVRQGDVEKQKIANRAQMLRGRIRALAADAGFEDAGTYQALQRQVNTDAALNTAIIRGNTRNELDRVASGLDANFSALNAQITSPILAAFTGAVSGAQSGLQIASAVPSGGGTAAPAATGTESDFFASSRQYYNPDREYTIP